jgi:hypothetical protein
MQSSMQNEVFDLDRHRLDEEWLLQPRLRREWGEKLAEARKEHDRAKANLNVVEAEIELSIRKNPSHFDLEKVTEGAVKATVLVQPEYQKAVEASLVAKHNVDVIQAYLDAIDDRKRTLENLVQLWLADYYAEPRVSGEAGKKMFDVEARNAFKSKGGK